jgi:hypothetical protein
LLILRDNDGWFLTKVHMLILRCVFGINKIIIIENH